MTLYTDEKPATKEEVEMAKIVTEANTTRLHITALQEKHIRRAVSISIAPAYFRLEINGAV